MQHKDLNRILCAAMVNEGFREQLLRNPVATIATGYEGFTFSLSNEEQRIVSGIQADNLEDFAAQVYAGLHPKRIGILVDLPARGKPAALATSGIRVEIPDERLFVNSYA
jgi:hypothetical protein